MWRAKIVATIYTLLVLGVQLLWYSILPVFSDDEMITALKYVVIAFYVIIGSWVTVVAIWWWALRKEKSSE